MPRSGFAFKRWALEDSSTVAALFQGCRRGIYVLYFADGDRYVGQTTDVVHRYATHRHGSKHHAPWPDIIAIDFLEVSEGDLNVLERETIRRHRALGPLRNRTFNFGHREPSMLDPVVPVEVQQHWATGQPDYCIAQFVAAAQRKPGPTPTLLTKRRGLEVLPDGRPVWEVVVDELAQVVLQLIPNATETEGKFWSISDYPETAGGRFATLNVGWLEFAAFPRRRWEADDSLEPSNGLRWFLNADIGTFVRKATSRRQVSRTSLRRSREKSSAFPVYSERLPSSYSVPVDCIHMPLGAFGVNEFSPDERLGARRLAIHAMRTGTARVNARSYSRRSFRRGLRADRRQGCRRPRH